MNMRTSAVRPAARFVPARAAPRRRQVLWRDWVALAGIWISFLASTYVSNVPVCLLGGVIFAGLALTERGRWGDYRAGLIAVAMAIVLFLASISSPMRLERFEVLKGVIGISLFLLTIIFGPAAVRRASANTPMGLTVLGMVMVATFLLEYLGILSLKTVGIVAWADNHLLRTVFDTRPSGLYGEPSWHALAAASLGFFLTKSDVRLAKGVAAALAVSCVLSGSSTGLMLAGLIGLRLTDLKSGRASARFVAVWLIFVSIIMLYGLLSYLDLYQSEQIQKIISPDKYGSGQSRFYLPWYYVQQALASRPILGMGSSYISERLSGLTGAAVLPINVFIEYGFVGLMVYLVYFIRLFHLFGFRVVDLAAFIICLITLGLQGSPFQAIMLVCFVVPWAGSQASTAKVRVSRAASRGGAAMPRHLGPGRA